MPSSVRVLVIEDDHDLLEVLRLLLHHASFDVGTAACGEGALREVRERPPDAVVLDVGLPSIAGAHLVAELRRLLPDLPVIVMSGYSQDDPRVASVLATGRCAYVAKPLEMPSLVAAVAHLTAA